MILNIEQATLENEAYRHVIYTDETCQVVLMNLIPNEEIGMEKHEFTTQFIKIEQGYGEAIVAGVRYPLVAGMAVIVPPDTYHNIIAGHDSGLQLYTVYSGQILHPPDYYSLEKDD